MLYITHVTRTAIVCADFHILHSVFIIVIQWLSILIIPSRNINVVFISGIHLSHVPHINLPEEWIDFLWSPQSLIQDVRYLEISHDVILILVDCDRQSLLAQSVLLEEV